MTSFDIGDIRDLLVKVQRCAVFMSAWLSLSLGTVRSASNTLTLLLEVYQEKSSACFPSKATIVGQAAMMGLGFGMDHSVSVTDRAESQTRARVLAS